MDKENTIKTIKKVSPFMGALFFLLLICMSTLIVFLSVASLFIYPFLWVVFFSLCYIFPHKNDLQCLLSAIRLAMWLYFASFFVFLCWTPSWLVGFSNYLEAKTWWNIFDTNNNMCGRISLSFLFSLLSCPIFYLRAYFTKKSVK